MPAPRYRKRRARSLFAASRFVLILSNVLGVFVLASVAGRGRPGMEPAQWAGLAAVAILAASALVGMALAYRIEFPPVEVIEPERGGPTVVRVANPYPGVSVPLPRVEVVEPTEILPARDGQ